MSEQEKNTEQTSGKSKKSFGNTIVLFIVFFIIFTALVTGIAFFADKFKRVGKNTKTVEQVKPEDLTDPDSAETKSFTVDAQGNTVNRNEPAPLTEESKPDTVLSSPPVEPQKQTPPEESKPVDAVKPAEPIIKTEPAKQPEPAKQSEPAKPAVKQEAVKAAVPAVKTETPKAEPAKPAVKQEAVKPEPVKTPAKAEPVKPAVKAETAKPAPVSEKKPAAAVVNKPGEYYVQLASFRSLELAKEEFQRLSQKIGDLQLVQVDLGEKGIWYRLRCGTPMAYDKALTRAEEISAKTGYTPDIMKK